MRIAHVVTGGFDPSGRERVIPVLLSLVERLARRHDVVVYVLRYFNEPRTYPLLGATIRDLGRPRGVVRQYRAARAAIRRDSPFDVVHGHWALPSGLVAAAVGRRLGIPSVVTLDSGEFVAIADRGDGGYGSQRHWRRRLGVRLTTRLATRRLVCTRFQERLALAHGVQVQRLPYGVDTTVFAPGLRPEGPPWHLLHVASLNPVKNQRMLLDAFRRVLDRRTDVHLDVAGEDTMGGAIQAHARALGVDRDVTFHGFLPTDRLVPLYQRSHVLVMSSRHEAAGIVMLEAAACGLPVVGTAVGYADDWAPECARAVAPGDVDALAAAIGELLDDGATRARIAENARQWAVAHNADWTAGQMERLYEELGT